MSDAHYLELLRDHCRDELLKLIDEAATIDDEYDEDGWPR